MRIHLNHQVQMCGQAIAKLGLHEIDCGESLFIFHTPTTMIMVISTIFKNSDNFWATMTFIANHGHIWVIGLQSSGICGAPWLLLFIVMVKKETCWSSNAPSNKLATKITFGLFYLGWQNFAFKIAKCPTKVTFALATSQYWG